MNKTTVLIASFASLLGLSVGCGVPCDMLEDKICEELGEQDCKAWKASGAPDQLRSSRRAAIDLRVQGEQRAHPVGSTENPGADLEAADERDLLLRALDRLQPNEREIIELRVIGGLSSDDIAVVLDKRPGAIRMAQSRALKRLRVLLKELEDA